MSTCPVKPTLPVILSLSCAETLRQLFQSIGCPIRPFKVDAWDSCPISPPQKGSRKAKSGRLWMWPRPPKCQSPLRWNEVFLSSTTHQPIYLSSTDHPPRFINFWSRTRGWKVNLRDISTIFRWVTQTLTCTFRSSKKLTPTTSPDSSLANDFYRLVEEWWCSVQCNHGSIFHNPEHDRYFLLDRWVYSQINY